MLSWHNPPFSTVSSSALPLQTGLQHKCSCIFFYQYLPILLTLQGLVTTVVFSTAVSSTFYLIPQIISEIIWYLSFSVWLISLIIMSARFICAIKCQDLFFLCQNIFVTYMCVFMFSVFVYLCGHVYTYDYEYVHVTLLPIHPSAIGLFSDID